MLRSESLSPISEPSHLPLSLPGPTSVPPVPLWSQSAPCLFWLARGLQLSGPSRLLAQAVQLDDPACTHTCLLEELTALPSHACSTRGICTYPACMAYNHLLIIHASHMEARLPVPGQVPSLCWEGLSQTKFHKSEQPFQMWFKWKPALEPLPAPTSPGWRLCILFHAVYSFEQIVSFTRHSKSVVANTCSHGECHLAH